jgi:hypothetical protein
MPEISRFFGIVLKMFWDDHNPPHFDALYGGEEALIEIGTLSVFAGHLAPRALGIAIEWATVHQEELMRDWERAQRRQGLERIEPLK